MRGWRLGLLMAVLPALGQAAPPATLALGGSPKSKYLTFDPASDRLFVAHDDEITVVDAKAFIISGHVAGLHGARGVALAPNGHGYATGGKSGDVTVFDAKTFRTLKTIPTGADSNFILYDASSRHVLALNDDADSVTVIDPATDTAVANIVLPGGEGLQSAAVDGDFLLYAVHSAQHDLVRIDTRRNAISGRFPLTGCARPQGLALDLGAHRAFVSCGGTLLVLDLLTGTWLQSLPGGGGSLVVLFDALRHKVYVADTAGTVSAFDAAPGAALRKRGDLPTGRGARCLALNDADGTVYAVVAPATLVRLAP